MKRSRLFMAVAALSAALVLAGCSATSQSPPKKHHSEVYVAQNGQVYTHCYDSTSDSLVWYVLYLNSQPYTSPSQNSVSSSALSGASWRSSTPPSTGGLTDTKQAIQEDENDEPSTDAEDLVSSEDAEAAGTLVTEDTTEQEAQQGFSDDESGANQGDNGDGQDNGGGSDSGDSGGDSGDSGGGDSGGGDAGGGGDG